MEPKFNILFAGLYSMRKFKLMKNSIIIRVNILIQSAAFFAVRNGSSCATFNSSPRFSLYFGQSYEKRKNVQMSSPRRGAVTKDSMKLECLRKPSLQFPKMNPVPHRQMGHSSRPFDVTPAKFAPAQMMSQQRCLILSLFVRISTVIQGFPAASTMQMF